MRIIDISKELEKHEESQACRICGNPVDREYTYTTVTIQREVKDGSKIAIMEPEELIVACEDCFDEVRHLVEEVFTFLDPDDEELEE